MKKFKKNKICNIVTINHKEGKNFDGIMKYLEKQYGKDLHEQGIISISASSSKHGKPE